MEVEGVFYVVITEDVGVLLPVTRRSSVHASCIMHGEWKAGKWSTTLTQTGGKQHLLDHDVM